MELFKTNIVNPLPNSLIEVARKHAPKKEPYVLPIDRLGE